MNVKEVAELLKFRKEYVKAAIQEGIELPKSKTKLKLKAERINNKWEIEEADVDQFISRFHEEEPGRHPPAAVRRALLVEANHRCGICKNETSIEFHHIIEYSKIKHYDVQHMLAVCPNCHTKCSNNFIDLRAQKMYKANLSNNARVVTQDRFLEAVNSHNFSWFEVRDVIEALYAEVVNENVSDPESQYDFNGIDIDKKNALNGLSETYYVDVIKQSHEVYFNKIEAFLKNTANLAIKRKYFEVVDELRTKIAIHNQSGERFEIFLDSFASFAREAGISRRTLNIILSYMYVNCDIGKKA